jgi:anti-sigma factor RsiW
MAEENKITVQGTHFDEAHLMMYIDGELPPSEADLLRAHLLVCPECRLECRSLQEALGLYTAFDRQFHESLPAPPHAWANFEGRLHEALAKPAVQRRSWLRRIADSARRPVGGAFLPWALSGAATALALVLLFVHSPSNHSFSVDDVLNRAQHEQASLDTALAPVVYQKIRITDSAAPQSPVTVQIWNDQKHGHFREEAGNWSQTVSALRQPEPPRQLRDLNAVYAANHLRWNVPLSADALRDWAQTPARKEESIRKEHLASGEEAYRLSAKLVDPSSIPASGTPFIQAMELLVRATDWHAVSERLTISSQAGTHTYEIAELEYRVIPLSQLPGNLVSALEGASAHVSDSGLMAASGNASLSFADLAVDVLDRLDRVDALVQDQVVVMRAGTEQLQVSGIVRSESRKAEILTALGSLASSPAVKLNVLSAGDARASGIVPLTHPIQVQSVEVLLNEAGSNPEVRTYLSVHRHVPERDLDQAADHFVTDAVEHSTEAQLNAQALKHIVEFVPLSEIGQASPEAREKWRSLVTRHAQASRREIHQLEQQLSPVFAHAASSGRTLAPEAAADDDLRPEADRLLTRTTDTDRILWQALSSNANAADRRGLTGTEFWRMLKEEDFLAAQIADKVHP